MFRFLASVYSITLNCLKFVRYLFISLHHQNTLATATGTRSQVRKNNQQLLPYTIITNFSSRILPQINSLLNPTHNSTIMADPTLLAKARKARFDDLPNFSGHPSEDVERFLKSIKNITKANDESANHELLEIVRGKLTQSAGLWFDNNEHNFKKWSDFETQFRNRYFSTTIIHKKFDQLKQRKQLHDEPVTFYIDNVINLCREIDPTMSDSTIIQHLMSGINPNFKKEISRHESCLHQLNEFLKYAKIEQDLSDTFEKSNQLSIEHMSPNIIVNHQQVSPFTAMINRPKQYYNLKQRNDHLYPLNSQSSVSQQNSIRQPQSRSTYTYRTPIQTYSQQKTFNKKYINNQFPSQQQFSNCKVCGRNNHRTIDCFYKRTTGCFNCANSTPLNIIGQITLELKLKSIRTYVNAHVATNLITSLLLGNDWINSNHVHLFGDQQQLTIPDQYNQLTSISYVEPMFTSHPALLVNQIILPPYSQTLVDISCGINHNNNLIFEPYSNYASKFIFIPHTLLNINNHKAKVLLINARNQPTTLPKNTRIGTLSSPLTYTICSSTINPTKQSSPPDKHNKSTLRLPIKSQCRAVTNKHNNSKEENSNVICDICNEYFLSGNDLQKHLRAQCYSEQIRQQISNLTKHIDNENDRSKIQNILWRNKTLFDPTPSIINIPPQSAIKTGDHPPIYSKQYPASYKDQEIKLHETQKLLDRGQIEESTSPWSSPIVLVKKKDKTMRFCIDYRRLNAITIKDAFPLPRIDEIFDQLSDATYYTKFDFKSGYFQVPLSKEDRPKTAFSTRDNHYQFTVLPQGISNGPATFQRVINHILGPTRWKYALAYIDDIIIYSKTFEEHILHLNEICTILKDARFRLNPEKCEIARIGTDYLGHNIKNGEIRPSLYNINGLLNTKLPQTPDEACKFVKAAEYYRKFIPNFSQIAEPLRKFVPTTKTQQRKGQKTIIKLTDDEVKAFQKLKHYLTTDLVLKLPNNRFPFKVQTDASDEGIGAVLLQIYPDGNRPVAYISKKFTPVQRKWSPMEQECYAFICALDKWHNYLSGVKFTWETDHKALTQLNQKAQINKRCERWRLKILEYDFKVQYIPGLTNSMPDYLSRSPVDDAEEDPDEISNLVSTSTQTDSSYINNHLPIVTAVETRAMKLRNKNLNDINDISKLTPDSLNASSQENRIIPFSIEQLIEAQQHDDYAKNIMNNIKKHKNYFIKDNLLMHQSKHPVPYIPQGDVRRTILQIYHDTAANGAHFGRDKTIHKIKTRYFWPSMYKDITNYIKSCITCAQYNPRRRKAPGKLQPIKPPDG
ncbi:unnamed protein product, partial [Rotaria sp. Silwood2]